MWIGGEDMPQETNRVTLNHDEKDKYGLPVPNVHYDDHPNDVAMRSHAYECGEAIYKAVGAVRTLPTPPYPSTHNLGTNRMSENPRDGVVNRWGQSHDIANLFVSDGSQFTTGAAENPTLTIVALAIRQADYLADGADVVTSLTDAPLEDAWVIGGAQIYAQALPLASRCEVTEVEVDLRREDDDALAAIARSHYLDQRQGKSTSARRVDSISSQHGLGESRTGQGPNVRSHH